MLLVNGVCAHPGRKPREVSGDAGFANEANHAALKEWGITGYLASDRARHGKADAAGRRGLTKMPLMSAMAARLERAGCRSWYRLRKQVIEPVFGQIKQALGFRQLLMRGLDQVNVWPAPSKSGSGSAGLSSLHKRTRPSGEPLAKMEIRVSWAS